MDADERVQNTQVVLKYNVYAVNLSNIHDNISK